MFGTAYGMVRADYGERSFQSAERRCGNPHFKFALCFVVLLFSVNRQHF